MKDEVFYDGELIEEGWDLWDFSIDVQERIREIFKETGFDKVIDVEKAFIPREEPEYIDLQELLGMTNSAPQPSNTFFSASPKMKPVDRSAFKDLILDNKVKYSDIIQHIHLSELSEIDESINFFPMPSNEEFLDLVESLENFGVLSPLLVIKGKESDKYTVVCGRSRLAALNHLYSVNQDERFLYAPCQILDPDTDLSIIQGIVISSNLSYKKISKETQIKSVLLLDKILKKNKIYKGEINITDKIAEKAGISRTTANTIRGFKNLSPKALDLLYKKHLTRGAARLLSMIEDHETQDFIIDGLGNQINDLRKIKEMIDGPMKRIYDDEAKTTVPETWEMKLDRTLRMVPSKIKIVLYVDSGEVEGVLKALIPLRGKAVSRYKAFEDGEINKYFKVLLNENDMEQYLRRGFVNKETLDIICSGDYKKVIKYA